MLLTDVVNQNVGDDRIVTNIANIFVASWSTYFKIFYFRECGMHARLIWFRFSLHLFSLCEVRVQGLSLEYFVIWLWRLENLSCRSIDQNHTKIQFIWRAPSCFLPVMWVLRNSLLRNIANILGSIGKNSKKRISIGRKFRAGFRFYKSFVNRWWCCCWSCRWSYICITVWWDTHH